MKWPPNKSWTSAFLRQGFRHFVAINYGGKGKERWVSLVSVLDSKSRLLVPWTEMKDNSKWISGWLTLSREEANPSSNQRIDSILECNTNVQKVCIHPSQDSGLLIPSQNSSIRPWN